MTHRYNLLRSTLFACFYWAMLSLFLYLLHMWSFKIKMSPGYNRYSHLFDLDFPIQFLFVHIQCEFFSFVTIFFHNSFFLLLPFFSTPSPNDHSFLFRKKRTLGSCWERERDWERKRERGRRLRVKTLKVCCIKRNYKNLKILVKPLWLWHFCLILNVEHTSTYTSTYNCERELLGLDTVRNIVMATVGSEQATKNRRMILKIIAVAVFVLFSGGRIDIGCFSRCWKSISTSIAPIFITKQKQFDMVARFLFCFFCSPFWLKFC